MEIKALLSDFLISDDVKLRRKFLEDAQELFNQLAGRRDKSRTGKITDSPKIGASIEWGEVSHSTPKSARMASREDSN